MEVTVRVLRFDPERDTEPHFEDYRIPADPMDRVLDALHYIKWNIDGSLTFRRSCAHGICGSDAVLVNGRNRLACKVLMRDLPATFTVEPIKGYAILKDLVVDMDSFFASYESVLPFLITHSDPGDRERLQTPEERERYDDTTKCILCAACTSSCPIYWPDNSYIGPATIVNAHRFIFDSRDQGKAERLERLNGGDGVWKCRTVFNCTQACPRDIDVTTAIQQVKRQLLFTRL
jgi:succinate dehydrogenase / fumarate reductase, iron-sulfur subunit